MEITQNMTISEKLKILTDAAKYDVACTSSGVDRGNKGQGIGFDATEYQRIICRIYFPYQAGIYCKNKNTD